MPFNADGSIREPTLAERTKRAHGVEDNRGKKFDWLAVDEALSEDKTAWSAMSEVERTDYLSELGVFMTSDKIGLLSGHERSGDYATVLEGAPRPSLFMAERRARFAVRPWLAALGAQIVAANQPDPEFDPVKGTMAEKSAEANKAVRHVTGQAILTASKPFRRVDEDQLNPRQATRLSGRLVSAILNGVAAPDGQATRNDGRVQK
jgi:hypothetical protein